MVTLSRATSVPVWGDPARDWKVTADSLAAAASPRTRGIMLNSPSNPTGAVYTHEELAAIVELALERGWWILSDEIYARTPCGVQAPALFAAVPPSASRDRLIVINGVAKAYAMTGWRIGWSISSRAVASAMTALQSHSTSNPASISQHAAVAAL